MIKMKLFLTLLILNCTLLIDEATAQWWVQGGNLLWPYGNVNIEKDLNVNGTITNDGVRPYKVYSAILTQTGTGQVVHTVLENTLGITFTGARQGVGLNPQIPSAQLLAINKSMVIITGYDAIFYTRLFETMGPGTDVWLDIITKTDTGAAKDNWQAYLEIRVYP